MMGIGLHKCFELDLMPWNSISTGVAAARCLALTVKYNNNMALSSIDICSSSSPHSLALSFSLALSLPSSPEHPFMPKFPPEWSAIFGWKHGHNNCWINEYEWTMSEWMNERMNEWLNDPERPLKRISRPHALDLPLTSPCRLVAL